MRLKEIKQGMAIHCKTESEAKELLGYLHENGYQWRMGDSLAVITEWEEYREETCYFIEDDKRITYDSVAFCKSKNFSEIYKYIRYTDLILPELTTEEVLQICADICNCDSCNECPMGNENNCYMEKNADFKRVIEICAQWKADHEKKEPELELEWFWQGRIYRVGSDGNFWQIKDGTGFYDTGCENRESAEEHMTEVFKEYCKNHEGEFVVSVDHVCRVKR